MRRKIPSIAALAAFESAARHQSFTRAAGEQSVTQSAICRQIATLEEFLGVKLFRRTKRGILRTEAGTSYSQKIARHLDELERETLALMARGGSGGTLELGVMPTFGNRWLLPRLAEFQRAQGGVVVNLAPCTRPFLFDESPLDAVIYAGESRWPGSEAHFLMREPMSVVARPEMIAPQRSVKPSMLKRYPLLQLTTRPYAWRQWFSSLGIEVEDDMVGQRFELYSMLTEAAIHGLGVALIPRFLIEEELDSGRLIEVVRHTYVSDLSYYLIHPEDRSEHPPLKAFREWIVEAAVHYRQAAGLG